MCSEFSLRWFPLHPVAKLDKHLIQIKRTIQIVDAPHLDRHIHPFNLNEGPGVIISFLGYFGIEVNLTF
jgi:hypothetical protein